MINLVAWRAAGIVQSRHCAQNSVLSAGKLRDNSENAFLGRSGESSQIGDVMRDLHTAGSDQMKENTFGKLALFGGHRIHRLVEMVTNDSARLAKLSQRISAEHHRVLLSFLFP